MKARLQKLFFILKIFLLLWLTIGLIAGLYLSIRSATNKSGELVFTQEVPNSNELFKNFAYISGGVNSPGVYEISSESKVIDLVNLAGGFTEDADAKFITKDLNLAQKVKDQDKIYIPIEGESTYGTTEDINETGLININTASQSQLESLPGIGEVTAKRIIEGRTYSTIEDLLEIQGISEGKLEAMRELITVE